MMKETNNNSKMNVNNVALGYISESETNPNDEKEAFYGENTSCSSSEGKKMINNVTFVLKDQAGVETLKEIYYQEDEYYLGDVPNTKSMELWEVWKRGYNMGMTPYWEYLLKQREGLLLGTRCNWRIIYNLLAEGYSDTEIKSMLATEYKDADFIELCTMEELDKYIGTSHAERSCYPERNWPEEGDRKAMIEMARNIANYLRDLGKTVTATIEEWQDSESALIEYQYLGSEVAEEIVIKNPNLILEQIAVVEPWA